MRVGIGFDIHKLVEGRPLFLGGIEIPFERGLIGHSDADALLHAISDAILGAMGLGDIGTHFPDTDISNKDISSKEILSKVIGIMKSEGFRVVNVDSNVIAEAPKIGPYREEITNEIALLLDVDKGCVGVKGKTMEKLGAIGRGEAIAGEAVVLLTED
jgi:2-C-methyl-D-erythritol 2,4-cyclodiphosphate synthase